MYNILFEKIYNTKHQFNVHLLRIQENKMVSSKTNEFIGIQSYTSVVKTTVISSKNEKVLSNLNRSLNIEDGLEILYFLCFHEFGAPSLQLKSLMEYCEGLL